MYKLICNLCISLILITSQAANASNPTAKELLIVRGNGQYTPNEMTVNNKLTGFHIDLIQQVAASINITVNFQSLPWKRAIEMMKTGKADAISHLSKSLEREAFVYFFDDNITSITKDVFFTLKEKESDIQYLGELSNLKPYSIATLRGYIYGAQFQQADYLKKQIVNELSQVVKLVKINRADIGLVSKNTFLFTYKDTDLLDKFTILEPPLSLKPQYLGFSKLKGHEQTAKEFAQAMKEFKKTTKYQLLLKNYGLL